MTHTFKCIKCGSIRCLCGDGGPVPTQECRSCGSVMTNCDEPDEGLAHAHSKVVMTLAKPGEQLALAMTPEMARLCHIAIALPIEACELADAIKKRFVYRAEIDRANVVEELGDIEFFLRLLRETLGITRKETIRGNIDKLAKRYPGLVYSDEAAIRRADKEGEVS